MQYLVYARKYRPKTFEEMIGQKAVVRTLQNAITGHRVAQAYLFSGMRGVGKTTAARILAKALNCEKGPTPTPCNVCETCREIDEDRSLDVLEIDGASNRGIDDIRQLRDSVRYKAIRSRTKVIYIDEVHQITKDGFNALLKTLEEPPPQTVFIFATTEFHKVPATIVSRCQHFEFKRVSQREIVNHLSVIAGKEGLTVSPFGLGLIAEASDGSIRDAQSLLDQAVAFCGESIGDAELKEILGVVSRDLLFAFSTAVADGRADQIFGFTDRVVEAGHDLRAFYKDLVLHFRNLLLVRTVDAPQDLLLFTAEDMARLKAEAEKAGPDDWLRRLQALQAAEGGLKFASHPQIYFETVLVRLCHFRRLAALEDILREVEILKAGAGDGDPRRGVPAAPPRTAPRMTAVPTATLRSEPRPAVPAPAAPPARPSVAAAFRPKAPGAPSEPKPPAADPEQERLLKDPSLRQFVDKFKARVVAAEAPPKPPQEES